MTTVAIVYTIVFLISATMLIGERGSTPDLRSRRGRRQTIEGGRRAVDPVGGTQI